jgi:hypothetical protein
MIIKIVSSIKKIKWHFTICLYVLVGATFLFSLNHDLSSNLYDYYKSNFRNSLFTGFLTLGGFLFTFKSFAILRLATVFESPEYQDRHIARKQNPEYSFGFLDPLTNLNDSVFLAIALSLVTSASQLTIGLLPNWFASLVCLWLALFSTVVLARTIKLLKLNIDLWLEVESDRLETIISNRESNKPLE